MAKNVEETNPLLGINTKQDESDQNLTTKPSDPPNPPSAQPQVAESCGWTADGLPMGLIGQPFTRRSPWSSGLCSCLGPNDDFCGTDVEVCLLGSIAPCVLYGSNAERLESAAGGFSNHCMTYTAFYLIGNYIFGWNCLAPWFSYTRRTAVRRRFNLEGGCESLSQHFGCCGSFVEDETQREQCEIACDFATHMFCHPCSLCQEGREIRRRLPHPGFNAQPIMYMVPPAEQTMVCHQ